MERNNKKITAFSLIELSMVLLVISFLLAASVPIFQTISENTKIKITNQKIKTIYEAMGAYLQAHGRIPCPASTLLTKTDDNYGKEVNCDYDLATITGSSIGIWQSPWNKSVIYGIIPAVTLGLPKEMVEDGFGSKIAYIMLKGYSGKAKFFTFDASNYTGNGASITHFDAGDGLDENKIRIHERNSAGVKRITASAIMSIISYGKNKLCAFNADSATENATSTDTDEAFNCATSYGVPNLGRANFYRYSYAGNSFPIMKSSTSENFDDIVFYKTKEQLMTDFNYFPTPACSEDVTQTVDYSGTIVTHHWSGNSSLVEHNSGTSNTPCPDGFNSSPHNGPLKKCGSMKRWSSDIIVGCVAN